MTMASSFWVNVDQTNPGQFFACCGLLELADRLWPGAEGWFENHDRQFHVACGEHSLGELLTAIGNMELKSSLGDEGLKRLAQLLSAEKANLSDADRQEKERLKLAWEVERVTVSPPFNITLDWWWDESSGSTLLKTWAAKQLVLEIARPLVNAIREIDWSIHGITNCLSTTSRITGLPFYYDANNNAQNTPRDFGVATAQVKCASSDRPLIELMTFIALQRYRPSRLVSKDLMQYGTWRTAQTPCVASAISTGVIDMHDIRRYTFRMLYRTKYMKAFLPSKPFLSTGVQ